MEKKKRNPKPIGERIDFQKIRQALKSPYGITKHSKEQMNIRNFSFEDIDHVLRYGRKLDRHDTNRGEATCSVIGTKVNGEWGAVAITIRDSGLLVVLTVMDKDK